jgi:hypothetical protein
MLPSLHIIHTIYNNIFILYVYIQTNQYITHLHPVHWPVRPTISPNDRHSPIKQGRGILAPDQLYPDIFFYSTGHVLDLETVRAGAAYTEPSYDSGAANYAGTDCSC